MSKRAIREARRMFAVPDPQPTEIDAVGPNASATVRLTARNRAYLAAGIHPATRRPLYMGTGATCGNCVHHTAYQHDKTWHKCARHRLGESRSAASDIRVSWPGCELWEER